MSDNVDAAFGDRGDVRWSVDLPFRVARCILGGRDGGWVATSDDRVVAGGGGTVRWQLELPNWPPILTGDGGVVIPRQACLSKHSVDDGTERWRVDGAHGHVAELAGGSVATIGHDGRNWNLSLRTPEGASCWERVVDPPIGAPIGLQEVVVVAAEATVSGFTADGNLVWQSTPDNCGGPARPDHRFASPPFVIDEGRIGIGVDALEWNGVQIVDVATGTSAPWRASNGIVISTMSPYAVCRLPAATAPALIFRHMVMAGAFDLDGAQIWSFMCTTPPVGFATDRHGRVAIAYSHELAHHDAYAWHDEGRALRNRCGVTVIEPDGRVAWNWSAPGPVAALAVASDGSILVTSEGRLWALG